MGGACGHLAQDKSEDMAARALTLSGEGESRAAGERATTGGHDSGVVRRD